jgi:hypothetical protein
MTMRVHIERLVLDPRTLAPAQVPRFQTELAAALQRLHAPPAELPRLPRDPVARLAERTAAAIHQHVVRR